MKKIVERARQVTRTVAVGLRRAVDPPLGDDATPLDVRQAILETIERRVQPAGAGRRILPDRFIRIKILAPDPPSERAMQAVLGDIQAAAMTRLREVRCDVPLGFRVDVGYVKARPAAWPVDARFHVDYPVVAPAGRAAAPEEQPQPALKLTVVRGTATRSSYAFTQPVVRVGRSEAPVDERGRVRRNDVAFLENEDPCNKTVTRGHCEIRFSAATGQYRVFDERSANGTRIVRGGEVIEVPARDPLGVAMAAGDELQLGQAALRVAITGS
jgi:hypothetical protein